jgi:hypothetical protein
MIADKLDVRSLCRDNSGAVDFFPVSDYITAMVLGAFEFYGDLHYSIISLLSPFVILCLSYFVDHPLKKKNEKEDFFLKKKPKSKKETGKRFFLKKNEKED